MWAGSKSEVEGNLGFLPDINKLHDPGPRSADLAALINAMKESRHISLQVPDGNVTSD
jgi:hypothetical protein